MLCDFMPPPILSCEKHRRADAYKVCKAIFKHFQSFLIKANVICRIKHTLPKRFAVIFHAQTTPEAHSVAVVA